jgi:hypothetical protein
MRKVGDKEAVYYGEAERTPGGLRKQDLMVNHKDKIVSVRQHEAGMSKVSHLHSGGARHKKASSKGACGGFSWPHLQGHINPVYLHQMDQGTYHIPSK